MEDDIKSIIASNDVKIVTDISKLTIPCEDVSIEDGEIIARKLFSIVSARGDAFGLSANQIGIHKNVCVINVKNPIYLINPKIVESSGSLIFYEGCLSFPNESELVRTKRFSSIVVKSDNYESDLYFDVSDSIINNNYIYNRNVIEIVAIQHEISHLLGKTMFDFTFTERPISVNKTHGRNDIVTISKENQTINIKYKNFHNYEKQGYKINEQ